MREIVVHCWMSNVEDAEERHGDSSPEYVAALEEPGTCLLRDGHEGPHLFVPDGDIVVTFPEAS